MLSAVVAHPRIALASLVVVLCLVAVPIAANDDWNARAVQTLIQDGKLDEAQAQIAAEYKTLSAGKCTNSATQEAIDAWRMRAMALLFGDAPWNAETGPTAAFRKKILARDALIDELALTLSEDDHPAAVTKVLSDLIGKLGNTALSQPALLTAEAVVWDQPPRNTWYRNTPDTDTLAMAFERCIEKMPAAERQRPARLLAFLTYSALNAEDCQYVDQTYPDVRDNPLRCYTEIRYDLMFFIKGTPKKIDSQPYTLTNIKKFGGVCIDQAYHTRGVCHANGIPAVILAGSGSSGIGHAWVGYVKPGSSNQIKWDFTVGTTPEGNFSLGFLTDPQTGKSISNLDLAAEVPELQASSDDRRRAAACARLIAVRARLDTSFAQDILTWTDAAFSRIHTHTATWDSLLSYIENVPGVSNGQLDTILTALAPLGKTSPEIMLARFDRLRTGVEKNGQVFETRWFEKMKEAVAGNATGVLALEVRLAQAEEKTGQRSSACERLFKIVREHPLAGNPVLEAADSLARMWRIDHKDASVLPMYLDLLAANKLPHPVAPEVMGMTMYFRLGQRLIAEYKNLGRNDDAQKLDDEIKKFIGG
ncbi:MAG TPA: hypothetical protein VL860_12125 [Planctomycetota bacterium]|nr:hypothetical protein [Planctomycetota bacterium]